MVARAAIPLVLMACTTVTKEDPTEPVDTTEPTTPVDSDTPEDPDPDPPVDTDLVDTDAPDTDAVVDSDPPCTVGFDVGDCPPDFTLDAVGGTSVTLSQHGAQRVIVIGTSNW